MRTAHHRSVVRGMKRARWMTVRAAIALLGLLVLTATFVANSASAETACTTCRPWWHLTSRLQPATIRPGSGKNEVQELKVAATGGDVVVEGPHKHYAAFPYNAEAKTVQGVLEAPEMFGAGNVSVSGGPGDTTGSKPYVVTFQGALAQDSEKPITNPELSREAPARKLGEEKELEGEASVTVATKATPDGTIVAIGVNLGDERTTGATTISDVLPAGFTVIEQEGEPVIEFYSFRYGIGKQENGDLGSSSERPEVKELHLCGVAGQRVSCTTPPPGEPETFPGYLGGLFEHLNPYEDVEIRVAVKAPAGASEPLNQTEVSGGGAASVSARRPIPVGSALPAFGAEDFSMLPEEAGGGIDTQAGSHPFQFTTQFTFNQTEEPLRPPGLPRNLQFQLPPGFIGNATAVAQCSSLDFLHFTGEGLVNLCPSDTVVGVANIAIDEPENLKLVTYPAPLFNLTPQHGEPARFGFELLKTPVFLDTSVRTGTDYGVTVHVNNITQIAAFLSSTVTFWGVPGDPRHNSARGWGCLAGGFFVTTAEAPPCEPSSEAKPPALLTMPTTCTDPFEPSVEGVSWPTKAFPEGASFAPKPYALSDAFGQMLGISGCNQLGFDPEIRVKPDGEEASKPTGLNVDVHVPQEVNANGSGDASSNVKDITVSFPEGVTVNPASADGLEACSEAQAGFTGFAELKSEPGVNNALFTPTLPEPLIEGVNFCPDASKIGTATIKSPLLPAGQFVEGALYLATPAPNGEAGMNPFNALIATYIIARDPISGVVVKLPGYVSLNESTGRVTATFENNPQLAFEDAEIHLFGGSRAPFSTPAHCGAYTTNTTFTPWSGGTPVNSASTFDVSSGPGGGAGGAGCPSSPLPFAPSLALGTTNNNAGAFSPLSTTIGREDGQQNIQTVSLHFPPGLSGILAGVKLCPEAQANAGTCPPESRIGKTIVSVGLGNEPFSVIGGEVFLTEKYAGAPFGLSIVNPAVAGPFNLGKVIVRAKIEVDPHTAQLTVTTGEIPHILKGIALQIKHVNVTIERPGFTFNPTNCNPMAITGTIGGVEGASATTSVPFQVTNCANLKFAPKFSVSTSGKTSKAKGASLTAKLSYPNAAQGTQTNIARVKVDLPKQLPSRLTTLQKACTNAQFELNPANCPKESMIGYAKVTTPLLPVQLEGPAVFVSHGGEAFPSLTMVLQGYGVTIDLVGTTFISRQGITSTTFKTVPDVPFNTFTLTLPQGKYSALAANGNLCTSKLAMPTEFLAQNGLKINQSTPISITGCAKRKTLTRSQKLVSALKACHKKARGKRAGCEKQARQRYGPLKRAKNNSKRRR